MSIKKYYLKYINNFKLNFSIIKTSTRLSKLRIYLKTLKKAVLYLYIGIVYITRTLNELVFE